MKVLKPLIFLVILIFIAALGIGVFFHLYKTNVIPLKYSESVERYAEEYQVPQSVIYAVIKCESGFDPQAVSHAGAVGLMQIMPDTFTWLTRLSGAEYEEDLIADPDANIHMGVYYLSWLYSQFGSWDTVLAAYNAGHNRVREWMKDPLIFSDGKLTEIPIRETKNYVEKVLKYKEQYLKFYPELT